MKILTSLNKMLIDQIQIQALPLVILWILCILRPHLVIWQSKKPKMITLAINSKSMRPTSKISFVIMTTKEYKW